MGLLNVLRELGLDRDDDALALICDHLLAMAALGAGIERRGRMWFW